MTRANKFLLIIRKTIYESDWELLLRDAKHLICDIDGKIADALSRGITRNNLQAIQRNLEHRIKTSFGMVFPDVKEELSQTFRFSWNISNKYISGTQIMMDFPDWSEINQDEDLRTMIYSIMSELRGMDMKPHKIEEYVKVFGIFSYLFFTKKVLSWIPYLHLIIFHKIILSGEL